MFHLGRSLMHDIELPHIFHGGPFHDPHDYRFLFPNHSRYNCTRYELHRRRPWWSLDTELGLLLLPSVWRNPLVPGTSSKPRYLAGRGRRGKEQGWEGGCESEGGECGFVKMRP